MPELLRKNVTNLHIEFEKVPNVVTKVAKELASSVNSFEKLIQFEWVFFFLLLPM
jgi:hypothetical protein